MMAGSVRDFQSQLVSIMEVLVNTAMCETTKLFETCVFQLQLDVSKTKEENEMLKSQLQSTQRLGQAQERTEVARSRNCHLAEKCYQKTMVEQCGSPWLVSKTACHTDKDKEKDSTTVPKPIVAFKDKEKDASTVPKPIVAFKDEGSEMGLIIIKQEDDNTAEYAPEISHLQKERWEKVAVTRSLLCETSKNRAVRATSVPNDGKRSPTDTWATVANEREATTGQKRRTSNLCEIESPCKAEAETVNQKYCLARTDTEDSPVRVYELGPVCTGEDSPIGINGPLAHWSADQDSGNQFIHTKTLSTTFPEEGAVDTVFRSRLRSQYADDVFRDFTPFRHAAESQPTQSAGPRAETEVSQTGQEGYDFGCEAHQDALRKFPYFLDGESPGSGDAVNTQPWDRQAMQPQGFPFQCGQCGRILSSAVSLEAHLSLHTGERPYSCTECGKTFPTSRGLNRHSQVHSGERQHHCLQCGKSFVYQFSLTKHQLIHSGERAHACKHCDRSFVFKSDLTIHMRTHTGETPHRCGVCGKEFKHRRALNMHLQGHTGERRHVCAHCGKSFLDLGNFKRHKRIHTGEKPYSCQQCGKKFTQSAHLKKHVLTHK